MAVAAVSWAAHCGVLLLLVLLEMVAVTTEAAAVATANTTCVTKSDEYEYCDRLQHLCQTLFCFECDHPHLCDTTCTHCVVTTTTTTTTTSTVTTSTISTITATTTTSTTSTATTSTTTSASSTTSTAPLPPLQVDSSRVAAANAAVVVVSVSAVLALVICCFFVQHERDNRKKDAVTDFSDAPKKEAEKDFSDEPPPELEHLPRHRSSPRLPEKPLPEPLDLQAAPVPSHATDAATTLSPSMSPFSRRSLPRTLAHAGVSDLESQLPGSPDDPSKMERWLPPSLSLPVGWSRRQVELDMLPPPQTAPPEEEEAKGHLELVAWQLPQRSLLVSQASNGGHYGLVTLPLMPWHPPPPEGHGHLGLGMMHLPQPLAATPPLPPQAPQQLDYSASEGETATTRPSFSLQSMAPSKTSVALHSPLHSIVRPDDLRGKKREFPKLMKHGGCFSANPSLASFDTSVLTLEDHHVSISSKSLQACEAAELTVAATTADILSSLCQSCSNTGIDASGLPCPCPEGFGAWEAPPGWIAVGHSDSVTASLDSTMLSTTMQISAPSQLEPAPEITYLDHGWSPSCIQERAASRSPEHASPAQEPDVTIRLPGPLAFHLGDAAYDIEELPFPKLSGEQAQ